MGFQMFRWRAATSLGGFRSNGDLASAHGDAARGGSDFRSHAAWWAKPCTIVMKDVDEDVVRIQEVMGAEVDVSFDCAGFSKTMSTALNATRAGGKVCLIGMGHDEMTVPLTSAAAREVDIVGIFRYKDTWPLCLEFLRSGKIDVKPLITHRFGFSQKEVEEAFEVSARGSDAIKVMFNL